MASLLSRDRSHYQIVLVGGGAMGALHARVISQHPRTSLLCVVDPKEETGRALAEQYETRWLPDLHGLDLADAVIVASPTETHFAWASHILDAGKPLLVEKPLSASLEETQAMIDRAAAGDIPLMCGFVERWNPAVMAAQSIVSEPLHFQSFRHSPYAERIKGGVVSDLLIHDIDIALRIFGSMPAQTRSSLGYFHPKSMTGAEDVAEVQLEFSDGRLATSSVSRIAQRKLRTITINEIDRLIELDLLREDVTIYRHVGNAMLEDNGGYRQQTVIDIPLIPLRREPLTSQLDHFLGLIDGEVDSEAERNTVLAPHEVIADILTAAAKSAADAGSTATEASAPLEP